MPSPVGHTLAGCCLAAAAWRAPALRSAGFAAALLAAANLPDVDFLGALLRPLGVAVDHQGPTHSLAFVAAATLPLALALRGRVPPLRAWAWLAGAGALHLLLDLVSYDGRPPIGIPLLWPFSAAWAHSPLVLFPGADRDNPLSLHNLFELLVELAVTLPVLWLLLRSRTPAGSGTAPAAGPLPGRGCCR